MDKKTTYTAQKKELKFKIENDHPDVGAYLYVFDGDNCVKDYLEDSVEACKSLALEEYGIPINEWHES